MRCILSLSPETLPGGGHGQTQRHGNKMPSLLPLLPFLSASWTADIFPETQRRSSC